MAYSDFLQRMQDTLVSWISVFDLSYSAQKLLTLQNPGPKGFDNDGPLLESTTLGRLENPENRYFLKTSHFQRMAIGLAENVENDLKNHKVEKPYFGPDPEMVISHSMILLMFSLLEEYEFQLLQCVLTERVEDFDQSTHTLKAIQGNGIESIRRGRIEHLSKEYSHKSIEKRVKYLGQNLISGLDDDFVRTYTELSRIRNEISHDNAMKYCNLANAINYFYYCIHVGKRLGEAFGDQQAIAHVQRFKLYRMESDPEFNIFKLDFPLV